MLQDYIRFATFDVFDEGRLSSGKMHWCFRRSDLPRKRTWWTWRLRNIAVLTEVEPGGRGWTLLESHSPQGDRNEFRSTLSEQRAPRATRRI